MAGQVGPVEQGAYLLPLPLIDHPLERHMLAQVFLDLVGRADLFQCRDLGIAAARVKQRQQPVMAGQITVQPRQRRIRPAAPQGMDDQRQGHLIEPGIKRLDHQLGWRCIADRHGVFGEQRAELRRIGPVKPACVEIKITLPEFIRLRQVQ